MVLDLCTVAVLCSVKLMTAAGYVLLQGHITEADLHLFAERHSLPQAYVRPFMDALRQQQQQQTSIDGTVDGNPDMSTQVCIDIAMQHVQTRCHQTGQCNCSCHLITGAQAETANPFLTFP